MSSVSAIDRPLSDQAAVAEAVRRAFDLDEAIYPRGGGTHWNYGAEPAGGGCLLPLDRLDRAIDYPHRDLTITVEAGVMLAALNRRLAEQGQRLPVETPHPDRATIGGAIAAAAAGPRRYRWGTVRDYVIGLTAVDGRGQVFSAGGRVVKNAAGYDLCRLLTGSLGTLGVIVQATLMVKPLPETSALVACDVLDLETAERLLASLVKTQTVPSAIELLAGPCWKNDPALGQASRAAARLVVGFEGSLSEIDWMVAQLANEWRAEGQQPAATLVGTRADPLWERMAAFAHPAVDPPSDATESLAAEIRVLPSAVTNTVRRSLEIVPEASILAHAGNGVVLVRIDAPRQVPSQLPETVSRLRNQAAAEGGSLVVIYRPPGAEWTRELVWGPPRAGFSTMQAIKDRFDPKGILNRGRFVFP